ncbi:MAG: caspase family protein [Nitrospira sp.]
MTSLQFTSMALDENGNLLFEAGERIRVRVDVVNTGTVPIPQATATLSGSRTLVGQFPSSSLSLPALPPGETKSIEFGATLPPTLQPQKAELIVDVQDKTTHATAPKQTLNVVLQATGIKVDDVDQIPANAPGFHQPQTFVIAIGIGSYRDPQMAGRKFAALDAEMVAGYLRALSGVPASNVRVLQDWKAQRLAIDEALLEWLPGRTSTDSTVIVYFAGQALITNAGDVLLVPHEGSPAATARLYPLKDLETALARLKAKHTLLLFDGRVSRLHGDPTGRNLPPRWEAGGPSISRIISSDGLSRGLEDEKHRHGLMTYYLLRALRGEGDSNRDGAVTLAELTAYVGQKVVWAAKSQFGADQRPLISPAIKQDPTASSLVLSRLAAIRGE